MLNRASLERHSGPNSNRASLRNSLAIDDPRSMAYVLYDQPPSNAHRQINPDEMATQFIAPETDLDEHVMIPADDTAMYMSVPHDEHEDDEVFVPPPIIDQTQPMNVYQQHPNDDELMYGLMDEKLMLDENGGAHTAARSGYRQMGIYGWRKKTIYLLLAFIVLLVGINAALTFWIVSYLGFSSNGISGLDLSRDDQIVFKGNGIFEKMLFASEVGSYYSHSPHHMLRFAQRNGNISFRSSWVADNDSNDNQTAAPNLDRVDSKLTVSKGKVSVEADNFELYDRKKQLVFAINTKEVDANTDASNSTNTSNSHRMTIHVDSLNVQNINSLRLPLSLQTPAIESGFERQLRIYSPQGKVGIRGPHSVAIESKFGDAALMAYDDIVLNSSRGKITMESKGIYLRNLATFTVDQNNSSTPPGLIERLRKPKVYQLCICQNGKLFLTKPDQVCEIHSNKDCI